MILNKKVYLQEDDDDDRDEELLLNELFLKTLFPERLRCSKGLKQLNKDSSNLIYTTY